MSDISAPLFAADDLIPRMVSDFGYRPVVAAQVAARLVSANVSVKRAFWEWWQTGVLNEQLEVESCTLGQLLEEQKEANPIRAFSTLAWIAQDPKQAMAMRRRGYDTIEPER